MGVEASLSFEWVTQIGCASDRDCSFGGCFCDRGVINDVEGIVRGRRRPFLDPQLPGGGSLELAQPAAISIRGVRRGRRCWRVWFLRFSTSRPDWRRGAVVLEPVHALRAGWLRHYTGYPR